MRTIREFFADLRRRKVFRVVAVYAVAAWAAIEVVETIFPLFLIPDVYTRIAVALAILGVPVAAGLSWAFDWTPEGLTRTPPAPSGREADHSPSSDVGVPGRDGGSPDPSPDRSDVDPEPSLAVLPFRDLSADDENRHFSDGITEEILSAVSGIPGLGVAARTSAFAARERTTDVREIGRTLGVATVLEGSVRLDGDRLRVTAQLVDAASGRHLFSQSYDECLDDVFRVQDDIALRVSEALRVALIEDDTPEDGERGPHRRAPTDPEAYRHHLRGTHLRRRRTPTAQKEAIEAFDEALQRDPSYAPSHAGRAVALALLEDMEPETDGRRFVEAVDAARRAVELDPDHAQGRAALGLARTLDWEWEAVDEHFRRAVELDPDEVEVRRWYSIYLTAVGRLDEARSVLAPCRSLDPLSARVHASAAGLEFYARRYEAALEAVEQTLELDDANLYARALRSLIRVATGRPDDARSELKDLARTPMGRSDPLVVAALGHVEATLGVKPAARRALADLEKLAGAGKSTAFCAAGVLAALNRRDEAFQALHRAVREHDGWMLSLQVHPWMDGLRDDDRYAGVLESMNLDAGGRPASGVEAAATN